jgi:hypothetical protein
MTMDLAGIPVRVLPGLPPDIAAIVVPGQDPVVFRLQAHQGVTMDTVPIRLPDNAKPGAVVELYRLPDGTMAAQVRIPAPRE